jgi:SAM-dependent methyltransferase
MHASARYDAIAHFYESVVGDDLTDPVTSALLDMVPALHGAKVLDVGCGHGRVARELARRGAAVIGVDVSRALLDKARAAERREPLGVSYLELDVTEEDALRGERFDGVIAHFALSDVDNLDGALTTIARVIRDGGWFVLSILHPCFPGWDDDAPSSWPPDCGYYAEGWWLASNTGFRGRVGANHRMLSTYLNGLADHDLRIEHVEEPWPGEAWAGRAPGRLPVPVYFVARCRRDLLP